MSAQTSEGVELLKENADAPLCYHPEFWIGYTPPRRMLMCDCSMNQYCPTCNFGHAVWPCKCTEGDKGNTMTVTGTVNYW